MSLLYKMVNFILFPKNLIYFFGHLWAFFKINKVAIIGDFVLSSSNVDKLEIIANQIN